MSEHRAAQHIKPKNEQASIGSPVRLHRNRSGVLREPGYGSPASNCESVTF
ncbi:hypothetical protein WQQ_21370 [Hydrocarboniphaga effusa AP103]|uniref:Uncharacterized protein n=1 Tax=Hydrocarboniphaga effusa AP103 TaxID=1172194 RepID=I8TDG4_9GAMM|nr:hypothetical protein WQQ_21370 [Hydrocarboniphaga effusa AP103]